MLKQFLEQDAAVMASLLDKKVSSDLNTISERDLLAANSGNHVKDCYHSNVAIITPLQMKFLLHFEYMQRMTPLNQRHEITNG